MPKSKTLSGIIKAEDSLTNDFSEVVPCYDDCESRKYVKRHDYSQEVDNYAIIIIAENGNSIKTMSLFRKLSSLFCIAFPCWSGKRGSPCRRELFCPIRQLQKQHDSLFCTSWHPLLYSSAKFSKKLFICLCSKYPLFSFTPHLLIA